MKDFYIYIIQVNIGLLIFYLLYRGIFSRDTFFEIRRLFLLTMAGLVFFYPFISLTFWFDQQMPLQTVMQNYATVLTVAAVAVVPTEEISWFSWQNIVLLLWGGGCILLLLRLLLQFGMICGMAQSGRKVNYQGQKMIVLSGDYTPFSFFNWMFVNPDCHDEKELAEIITHEQAHIRQWHSFDMLLSELLCILFWFNPTAWLLRKEIRHNLEFLADRDVVSLGYNRKNYQYHLLRLSHQSTAVKIVNNFNVSSLKKRILMMNKKRTSRIALLKYALLFPVTGLLILSSNAATVTNIAENTLRNWQTNIQKNKENQKTISGTVVDLAGKPLAGVSVIIPKTTIGTLTGADGKYTIKVNGPGELSFSYVGMVTSVMPYDMNANILNVVLAKSTTPLEGVVVTGYFQENTNKTQEREVFIVVEEMPEFIGGDVQKYLARNVKYPVEAMENKVEGEVQVTFVIDRLGKVKDAKVTKSVSLALDKEALRVVNSMPDWKPGKQRGKAVDVEFTLPIKFVLYKSPATTDVKTVEVSTGFLKPVDFPDLYKNGKPLIMIDGVQASADFNLESLDAKYVKSVSVLKNETARKVYGEAGRNGVIIIEMKK